MPANLKVPPELSPAETERNKTSKSRTSLKRDKHLRPFTNLKNKNMNKNLI